MFHLFDPMYRRMHIVSPKQLQQAIDLAIKGNKKILIDIGSYIAANRYLFLHIKEGSAEDHENREIYNAFKQNHLELFTQVEGWANFHLNKWTMDNED